VVSNTAAFAVAVCGGARCLDLRALVLAIAISANAERALLRILEIHAGVAALPPLNWVLYLPVTLLARGTVAAWLAIAVNRLSITYCLASTRSRQ
jgi:hypothetical protein